MTETRGRLYPVGTYPTMEAVEAADQYQILAWARNLPSPDDDDRPTLNRIVERDGELRKLNPAGRVAASKALMR